MSGRADLVVSVDVGSTRARSAVFDTASRRPSRLALVSDQTTRLVSRFLVGKADGGV